MPTTRRTPKPRAAARTAAAPAAEPKPRLRLTKAERELQRLMERVRPRMKADTVDPIDFLMGKPDVVTDLHALLDALEAAFGDCEMTLEARPAEVVHGHRKSNVCTVSVVDPPDPSAVLNVWGDWVNTYYDAHPNRWGLAKKQNVRIMAFATRKEWVAA